MERNTFPLYVVLCVPLSTLDKRLKERKGVMVRGNGKHWEGADPGTEEDETQPSSFDNVLLHIGAHSSQYLLHSWSTEISYLHVKYTLRN